MKSGLGLCLFLILLSACAPTVVWYGQSPDHTRKAEIMHLRADQWVRIDGRDGPVFEGIGAGSLVWSADGKHVAYAARRERGWTVVADGERGATWDGIGEIVWAPGGDRVAFQAERGGSWFVVDGSRVSGPAWDALAEGVMRFDGANLAYVGTRGDCTRVVVGEDEGPCFDAIGHLVLAGGHAVYVGRRGERAFVVTDGMIGEGYEGIAALAVGPGGRPVVLVARDDGADVVVKDDVVVDRAEAVSGLALATDGRAAWVALAEGRAHLVVDGVRGRARDLIDPPVFGPDGRLAYIEKDGVDTRVVVNDKIVGTYDDAGELVLGGKGAPGRAARAARAAWIGRVDGEMRVVVDGVVQAPRGLVPGTLSFSSDGARWGCLARASAGARDEQDLVLYVDGRATRALDFDAVISYSLSGQRAGRDVDVDAFIKAWVQAELERP